MSSAERLKCCLERIGLGTLWQNFADEKIEDDTFNSLTDGDLMRLGITTIGNSVRLREKMRSTLTEDFRSVLGLLFLISETT